MKLPLKLLLAISMAVTSMVAFAQESPNDSYKGGNMVVEAGGLVGMQKFGMYGVSVAVLGGYTFNKHWFVGGGIGFKNVTVDKPNSSTIPVFARVKYSILKSKVTPYLSLDGGYYVGSAGSAYNKQPDLRPGEGYTWVTQIKGGWFFHPEVGVSVRLKKRQAIHFGIGYGRLRGSFWRQERALEKMQGLNHLNELTFRIGLTL